MVVLLIGAFGLVIGSFLNVVIYRVPNGLSIVSPPSACPKCGSRIRASDNVPVVSWVLLRGKCRRCSNPISPRYPLVELGTGVAFAVVAFGVTTGAIAPGAPTDGSITLLAGILTLVAFLYLATISIALALIDIDVHRLPNAIVLPSYLVGVVLLGAAGLLAGDVEALVGAAVGLVALWSAYLLMALAYPGGMGFGDVKLAGVLGLYLGFLGWGELVVGAFAAFLLGGLFSIALLLMRKASRRSAIPFGPWMLVGAWVGILCGGSLWGAYLALMGIA